MLDKILNSCKNVMKKSEYVKINYEVLDKFINKVNCNDLKHWLSSNPYGVLNFDVSTIVNLLLYFEGIDYSFWGNPKWTIETELGLKDGSDALLYTMIKYVKENDSVNFGDLSKSEFEKMLEGNVFIPLLNERYNTLVYINKVVKEKMGGNFYKYIEDIKTDKELFDVIISNFECFKDERIYDGDTVYFYKLAQLLTSDILHVRETLEGGKFDYSNLLGCADYKIPQTLRALGIIQYNDILSKIVDNKREIEVSSKYEVEIRASMIVVIDYIKNKLENVNAIDINDYFFVASKELKKDLKPYHLTRNVNY